MTKNGGIVYPTLEGKISERGIRRNSIAKSLGISDRSFTNKLNGRCEFTWSQVRTIQSRFFPDIDKDTLFASISERDNRAS